MTFLDQLRTTDAVPKSIGLLEGLDWRRVHDARDVTVPLQAG